VTTRIYRYEVPVDDCWHTFKCGPPLHVACRNPAVVEFWAHPRNEDADEFVDEQRFRVYGTGHDVPDEVLYVGTAIPPRRGSGLAPALRRLEGSLMTVRVRLREHPVSDCLDVFIIREADHGRYVLHTENSNTFRWDELPPPTAALSDGVLEPTIVLPSDSGRALLEALVRHYNGAEDTRTLRRDYDAERRRVDEQNKVIADVARILARKDTQESPHARST